MSTSTRVPPIGFGPSEMTPPSSDSTSVRTIDSPRLPDVRRVEVLGKAATVVVDLHLEPPGRAQHRGRACCARLAGETVLDGVLADLGQHHRQRRRHLGRELTERALAGRGQLGGLRARRRCTHRGQPVGDLVEVDALVERLAQRLVHDRDRPDPANGLLERQPRLRHLHPPRLQPQQGGHRLQVVLDPVVDLADRRILGEQLALAAAQLGDVAQQDRARPRTRRPAAAG